MALDPFVSLKNVEGVDGETRTFALGLIDDCYPILATLD